MSTTTDRAAQTRDDELLKLIDRARRESEAAEKLVTSSRREREHAIKVLRRAGIVR